MFKGRVYPKETINLNKFKKSILEKMEDNLNDYQAFKIRNKYTDEFEYILLKKNSLHYKTLTEMLYVNKPIYIKN